MTGAWLGGTIDTTGAVVAAGAIAGPQAMSVAVVVKMAQNVLIGAAAGVLCVLGYAVIQGRLQKFFKIVDTCGVHNLHGMPGLFGGLVAILVVPGIAKAQIVGIVITVVLALVSGRIGGLVIKALGTKRLVYEDKEEFAGG